MLSVKEEKEVKEKVMWKEEVGKMETGREEKAKWR